MNNVLSLRNSWDLIAVLVAIATFGMAMYQFVVGEHYMIPTAILFWTILFGNLARRGLQGAKWAKYLLFWYGFLMSCLAFMGIFFAQAPKVALGSLFLPVWIAMFLLVAWLTWQYRRANSLTL